MQKVQGLIFAFIYFNKSFIFPLRYYLYGSLKVSFSNTSFSECFNL